MSYIICFWDKSKIQITDQTAEKLKEAIKKGEIKTFELEDNLYSVNGVEKIIHKGYAFDVFPAEYEYLKSLEDHLSKEEMENLVAKLEAPTDSSLAFDNWKKLTSNENFQDWVKMSKEERMKFLPPKL